MLSLRARLFIIISLVVLFILGISLLLIIARKNPTPTVVPGGNEQVNTISINNGVTLAQNGVTVTPPSGAVIKPATPLEAEQNAVKQLARIFLERYSTYSTDNDYQNITDVQELVTPEMWIKISARMKTAPTAGSFVGVTTNVISMDLGDWSADKAMVVFKTNSVEEKNSITSSTYQTVQVFLVKTGDNWLVEKFAIVK